MQAATFTTLTLALKDDLVRDSYSRNDMLLLSRDNPQVMPHPSCTFLVLRRPPRIAVGLQPAWPICSAASVQQSSCEHGNICAVCLRP